MALRHLARHPGRRRNSFIKQVMDQVKKDMEADDKLRKDWERVASHHFSAMWRF